jgi:hypothetical protein
MKTRLIGSVVFFLAVFVLSGCNEFNKTVNGLGGDFLSSAETTKDGGGIFAGLTYSPSALNIEAWLVKMDPKGNKAWENYFGGTGIDAAYSTQQTVDGGYILAGLTESKGAGAADVWLIKTDEDGNMLWDKVFGGTSKDVAYCVRQTTDGGYIIAATTLSMGDYNGDFWLIKTDSDGNKVWDKIFGGTDVESATSVLQTADGGYIMTGCTQSYGAGGEDVWLLRTDSSGNKLWDKTYGGTDFDSANSVIATKDGGYIIAGYTFSYGAGGEDGWIIKTDASGNKLWDKTYGGVNDDSFSSVKQTSNGRYLFCGIYDSSIAYNSDMWLIKTDASGKKLLDKKYGGDKNDFGVAVFLTADNGYLLAGNTLSYGDGYGDAWLIKTDTNGNAPAAPK